MKNLLLIPAMLLLCFSCTSSDQSNNNKSAFQENAEDTMLTTKVKTAIMTDASISTAARFVSVSTTNGVVTLTGTVPTQKDMNRIVYIVKNVDGVVSVNNQMTVSNSQ